MSLAEILDEIPRLSSSGRREVAAKILELDGDWIAGDDDLDPEEIGVIECRVAEHDANPGSAIPWEGAKARLLALIEQ